MNAPLTFSQASSLCSGYQYLKGLPFDSSFGSTTSVLEVMVAPWREEDQQRFMNDYDRYGRADINDFDPQHGYTVIAIAKYDPDLDVFLWVHVHTLAGRNFQQVNKLVF